MTCPHHISVDVEEYFHASAMEPFLPRRIWDGLPRHSPGLVDQLLALLSEADVKATFFVLGWLAEKEPEVVKAIAAQGHEIASHGWYHQRVNTLSASEFSEDVTRSRHLLQDLSGAPVVGYRAPSFSILPGVEWALDVLLEAGFLYDSSMYPVRIHPGYGYPDAERDPHLLKRRAGSLVEMPPATLKAGPLNLPAAGGAYLRFFPLGLIRRALKSAEVRGVPGTLYIHPWELDQAMPAFRAPPKTQLRMRGGIRTVRGKLSALLREFPFHPMIDTANRVGGSGMPGGA